MFKIQVKDFGPIIEGTVDLKPLTIFVGPNNSGKSYMAMLLYSLLRSYMPESASWALPRLFRRGMIRTYPPLLSRLFANTLAEHGPDADDIVADLRQFLDNSHRTSDGVVSILFGEFPEAIRSLLDKYINESVGALASTFEREVRRCYGSEITNMARMTAGVEEFKIQLQQDAPSWRIGMSSAKNEIQQTESDYDLSRELISFRYSPAEPLRSNSGIDNTELLFLLQNTYAGILDRFYQQFPLHTYYFPAARSGILQSHKALASFVMSRSPLVGIEPIDIPRLTGVIVDFISSLILLEKDDDETSLSQVAAFLEGEVLRGNIFFESGKLEYPEIFYRNKAGRFPLHNTSSMVSEMAPVILFLKYLIGPGDMMVLEEPESHLHVASQRRLARAIAKLVRSDVKVLITTHSENFLGQLSNLIRLGQLSGEERIQRGYHEEDYLVPEEVGAYLFRLDDHQDGSFIEELPVTLEEGIPEDEFSRVIAELYDETVYLDQRIST